MATSAHQKLIRQFYYLLNDLQLQEQKQNLIEQYGVDSVKDMTVSQLGELCGSLHKLQAKQNKKNNETPPEIRKKRSVIINLLDQLGIYTGKNSWPRVNQYLDDPRIAGKQMWRMSEEELDKLAVKLRAILLKQEKERKKNRRLAKLN